MGMTNVKASTRHLKSGKIVQVAAHQQERDAVGDALKAVGRVPLAAKPGTFPNGRSTPGSTEIWEAERKRRKSALDKEKAKQGKSAEQGKSADSSPAQKKNKSAEQGKDKPMPKKPVDRAALTQAQYDLVQLARGKDNLAEVPGKNNWIEHTSDSGLPEYIAHIAKTLMREEGMTKSRAIGTAISRVKLWSATSKNPEVKAKASAAVAQWEKLKADNKARHVK